ncbi:ABC transporter ATP-binding protein [bacterium]|jgi:iron(III) transport system ATP-binding protein|nr:ABC transporter ATP-binding protein [bacterium]
MVGVTLDQVTKRFDRVVAVDRVSLEIAAGEFFFLLGPSGCGKTTLLRMIAGFYTPGGGRVLFGDRDVTNVPPNERNTGMVFQNYALWPHMTVRKNVEYGLTMRSVTREEMDTRVDRALEMVQMSPYADRSPNQLSGGQQQRVALARALVIEPDVVLMDEPLSNLDARLRLEMRQQILDLQREIGTTMIYVTHDQKEALAMSHRMAVMDRGHVVQVGTARELYQNPNSRFLADFIGEINFIAGTVAEVGEVAVVNTGLGQIKGRPSGSIKRGDSVLCAVRPEGLEFVEGEPGVPENMVSGQVRHAVYLGEVEQYVIDLVDGTPVRMVEYDPVSPKASRGDMVRLQFSSSKVVVLPADGEADAETV